MVVIGIFRYDHNDEQREIRCMFQVLVSPPAYQVGPETIGATTHLDPPIPNDCIEWYTKADRGVVLFGLLVQVK